MRMCTQILHGLGVATDQTPHLIKLINFKFVSWADLHTGANIDDRTPKRNIRWHSL